MDSYNWSELREWAGGILIGLVCVELIILFGFAVSSGSGSYTYFFGPDGSQVHKVTGTVTENEMEAFREVHGIPEGEDIADHGYSLDLQEKGGEFNTRGWIAVSIGVPVFLLLMAVAVTSVLKTSFFVKEDKDKTEKEKTFFDESSIQKTIEKHTGFNVVIILCIVLVLVVVGLWLVPSLLLYIGHAGANLLAQNKTAIFVGGGLLIGIFVLITILRHKKNMKIIDAQTTIQMNRDALQTQYQIGGEVPGQLRGGKFRQIGQGEIVDADAETVKK